MMVMVRDWAFMTFRSGETCPNESQPISMNMEATSVILKNGYRPLMSPRFDSRLSRLSSKEHQSSWMDRMGTAQIGVSTVAASVIRLDARNSAWTYANRRGCPPRSIELAANVSRNLHDGNSVNDPKWNRHHDRRKPSQPMCAACEPTHGDRDRDAKEQNDWRHNKWLYCSKASAT